MRWDSLTVKNDEQSRLPGYKDGAVVRTFDAPETLGTRFYEVRARSALNKVKGSRVPFNWTINPYRGCAHACVYCFARPSHRYLDFNCGKDFDSEIVVKVNIPEVLRVELSRPSWQREHVALGTNTDPYQWVEGRYKLMTEIWKALRDSHTPCSVLTKSPLLLRDIELFKEIKQCADFSANLSVPTVDEHAWRATEPHTPSPLARLEAVKELNQAGIPTGVFVAPLMPGINDSPSQLKRLFKLIEDSGAVRVGAIPLNLRGETKDVFFSWLKDFSPELTEQYEELFKGRSYLTKVERQKIQAAVRKYRYFPIRQQRSSRKVGSSSSRAESKPDPQQKLF